MAEIPHKIIELIKKLIAESEKENIHIEEAILFGSYAKGNNDANSDIDIALISEDFTGTRYIDNQKMALPIIRRSFDIETHPFRPEDFVEDNPLVREILKYGKRMILH